MCPRFWVHCNPTPLSPPLLGGETTSWGFLSRFAAQKAPEKGIFTPPSRLGKGDGGLGDGREIDNDLVLCRLCNTTIQMKGLIQHSIFERQ